MLIAARHRYGTGDVDVDDATLRLKFRGSASRNGRLSERIEMIRSDGRLKAKAAPGSHANSWH